MTLTIELPDEMEARLGEIASRFGTTPEGVVGDMVRRRLAPVVPEEPPQPGERTMYDRLKPYIGRVRGPGGEHSERLGDILADDVAEKQAAGGA